MWIKPSTRQLPNWQEVIFCTFNSGFIPSRTWSPSFSQIISFFIVPVQLRVQPCEIRDCFIFFLNTGILADLNHFGFHCFANRIHHSHGIGLSERRSENSKNVWFWNSILSFTSYHFVRHPDEFLIISSFSRAAARSQEREAYFMGFLCDRKRKQFLAALLVSMYTSSCITTFRSDGHGTIQEWYQFDFVTDVLQMSHHAYLFDYGSINNHRAVNC